MSPNYLADVRQFHTTFDVPVCDTPQVPDFPRVRLRLQLIDEEATETRLALFDTYGHACNGTEAHKLPELASELCDLLYVVFGTALEFGIPLGEVWEAVHAANMRKATGGVRRSATGKILKPDGWKPADIAAVLRRVAERRNPVG